MIEYGLQLFSLRDISDTAHDLEGALRIAAETGYKKIEFAGFFGHSSEEVRTMLNKYGLQAFGTHTWVDEIRPEKIEETIRYHSAIGCPNLILPAYKDQDLEESLDDVIKVINYAQPILEKAGIRLGFHNHSAEFLPRPFGKVIFDELYSRTRVNFELDTFWAFNADRDPVALMKKLHAEGRLHVIHLKDGIHAANGEKAKGRALGEGEAPVTAVLRAAAELGIDIVVESEGLSPTGPEEIGRCMSFLRAQNI